ncbi:hypothetical protein CC1G_15594 [Coprinopsis cinerea okayama7|uniref:Uncharacterized protein n=1 Tax=Coprinopsis cinerea (strain Okayama-7 / 130 / ATCC MYA-4618 / FGSC 9003) TaxID=240176 RepID=D6RNC4_COPC7|nr:hypothetical protein CC1G_15594 [Coprinopsis cinerea okayama7\|eukprot:XP_002911052.1 hypothetical protein CC1G_15594 [Coprinopsis cinerea okayama7\
MPSRFLSPYLERLKSLRLLCFPHPLRTLRRLFWPIPWKFQPLPPLNPLELRRNPSLFHRRYYEEEIYKHLHSIPLFQLRDTPLASLYRLHDAVAIDSENEVMMEGEYFWHQAHWRVKDIPDPKDPHPVRYAILAGIVEQMVLRSTTRLRSALEGELDARQRIPTTQIVSLKRNLLKKFRLGRLTSLP